MDQTRKKKKFSRRTAGYQDQNDTSLIKIRKNLITVNISYINIEDFSL